MLSNGLQINGGMDVSQENGTTAGALGTGNIYCPADQFFAVTVGSQVLSVQNVADAPPGLTRSIKISVTTANASLGAADSACIRTKIEGYRTAKLAFGSASAQSLSIGFWVKAHRAGNYSGVVRNSAGNRTYPFSFAVNVADTWEFTTLTIAGDTSGTWLTDNGVGLDIFWAVAAGSTSGSGTAGAWTATTGLIGVTGTTNGVAATSDTFQLTGVIVLPGVELPAAARSGLILRPYDQEFLLCARYFYRATLVFAPCLMLTDGGSVFIIKPVPQHGAPAIVHGLTNTGFTSAGVPGSGQFNLQVANVATATKTGTLTIGYASGALPGVDFLQFFGCTFNRITTVLSAHSSVSNCDLNARL